MKRLGRILGGGVVAALVVACTVDTTTPAGSDGSDAGDAGPSSRDDAGSGASDAAGADVTAPKRDAGAADADATVDGSSADPDAAVDASTDDAGHGSCPNDGVCAPNATESCGAGGTRTCGSACQWSACNEPIVCGSGTLQKFAKAFPRRCAKPPEGNGECNDYFSDVAVDCAGNAVVVGSFSGELDLGTGYVGVTSGVRTLVVAKFSPAGQIIWSKLVGDPVKVTEAASVSVDGAGNVYVAANVLDGAIDFGLGAMRPVSASAFAIAKISPTGTPIWQKLFESTSTSPADPNKAPYARAVEIRADDAGNVALTGRFQGDLSLGGPAISYYFTCAGQQLQPGEVCGGASAFVARLDPQGNHLWSRAIKGATPTTGLATDLHVAHDTTHGVALSGMMGGTLDLGNGTTPASGALLVAQLDPAGNAKWAKGFGGGYTTGIRYDASGNPTISAWTDARTTFNGATVPPCGVGESTPSCQRALLIGKLDAATGAPVFTKALKLSPAGGLAISLADATNDVVVTGWSSDPVILDGSTSASGWKAGAFAARYTSAGAYVTSTSYGTPDRFPAITTRSPTGAIVSTGFYKGTMTIDGAPFTSATDTLSLISTAAP